MAPDNDRPDVTSARRVARQNPTVYECDRILGSVRAAEELLLSVDVSDLSEADREKVKGARYLIEWSRPFIREAFER